MNHYHSNFDEQKQLDSAIKRLRPYHIKAAAMLKTDSFDFFCKSSMLISAFLLGMYVSI